MLVLFESTACWATSDCLLVTSVAYKIFQSNVKVRAYAHLSIQIQSIFSVFFFLWFDVDKGPPRDIAKVKQVLSASENICEARAIP